ncbi:MAG: archease [Candidatus Bathyarchaeota archaeon]|nr:archease [Candidatus Bathyarchaeota archaeon]
MKRFEFLEHTADAYVAAYGKTLEEAFENAAYATFEVMTEAKKIEPKIEEDIEVEGYDEQALLYNWLEAFLVKFDTMSKLYSRFQISKIERIKEGYKLKAKIWGETYNSERHPQKVGIKAVTYHRMEIIKKLEKVTLKFVLDI